jgi:hypothetical protein
MTVQNSASNCQSYDLLLIINNTSMTRHISAFLKENREIVFIHLKLVKEIYDSMADIHILKTASI